MNVVIRISATTIVFAVCLLSARADDIPKAPEAGGPRNFEVSGVSTRLNMRESPAMTAAVVARLAPGAILSNLGCQSVDGRAWCYVQPLEGGPVGFVDTRFVSPATGPDGTVPTGLDDSSLRAGQGEFDATGQINCSMPDARPEDLCSFGVARSGGGFATVVVSRPDGIKRAIFFSLGRAMGTDSVEADPSSFLFQAEKEADLNVIRIGDERYEIPDAVVFGG